MHISRSYQHSFNFLGVCNKKNYKLTSPNGIVQQDIHRPIMCISYIGILNVGQKFLVLHNMRIT